MLPKKIVTLVIFSLLLPVSAISQTSPPSTTAPPSTLDSTGTVNTDATSPAYNPAPVPAPAHSDVRHYVGVSAGIGLPRLTNVGINYLSESQYISAEIAYGYLDVKSGSTQVRSKNIDVAARYHPWQSSFFVGAAVGSQTLTGDGSGTVSGQQVSADVDIRTTYVTPQVGWMWGAQDGGFFGQLDLGWQAPLNADVSYSTNSTDRTSNEYRDFEREVRDAGRKLGEVGIPSAMIKVGWLF